MEEEEPRATAQFLCEAMRCDGKFDICVVDTRHTLHNRIHKPDLNMHPLRRFHVGFEIIEGLKRMERDTRLQQHLAKLNPHWILLGAEDQVFLKVRETGAVPPDKGLGMNALENDNLHRWIAPELGQNDHTFTGSTKEATSREDLRAASVFSLGLVLLEMETGIVPFGEIDGVNAQRQLGTGTRPNMTNVLTEMKELISECLDVDKTARPTLEKVQERLVEIGQKSNQLTSEEAQSIQEQLKKKTVLASI
ncbi:hypothetical protein BLNAU_22986 [Blattamonas nauphoetae]|uniref:Protein kinase domain-containing protein n=1 Tax=Blattamonas nauphoetae TaxID=2049346 RepID=A0ABQ9WSP5_9EUKA|nr:hypothetical protein BLNAU_22986 [Blattamonas nauphoetae]